MKQIKVLEEDAKKIEENLSKQRLAYASMMPVSTLLLFFDLQQSSTKLVSSIKMLLSIDQLLTHVWKCVAVLCH